MQLAPSTLSFKAEPLAMADNPSPDAGLSAVNNSQSDELIENLGGRLAMTDVTGSDVVGDVTNTVPLVDSTTNAISTDPSDVELTAPTANDVNLLASTPVLADNETLRDSEDVISNDFSNNRCAGHTHRSADYQDAEMVATSSQTPPHLSSDDEDDYDEDPKTPGAISPLFTPPPQAQPLALSSQQRSDDPSSTLFSAPSLPLYHVPEEEASTPYVVDEVVPLLLLSLPVDSLHSIASFLNPKDWASMRLSSRGASRACHEVFRRVRMHGFKCATEIITAWVRGQHADSRELSGLYVRNGVPVYPLSLGHSYHSIIWRMLLEAEQMERNASEQTTEQSNIVGDSMQGKTNKGIIPGPKLDSFFTARNEARSSGGYYIPSLTYLEEKCLFMGQRSEPTADLNNMVLSPERRRSLTNGVNLRPPLAAQPGGHPQDFLDPVGLVEGGQLGQGLGPDFLRLDVGSAAPFGTGEGIRGGGLDPRRLRNLSALNRVPPPRRAQSVNSLLPPHDTYQQPRVPKMVVHAHRHLVDRHLLGSPAVNDEGGAMHAAPVSLSADFFHPHLKPSFPTVHPYPLPFDFSSRSFGGFGDIATYGLRNIGMAPVSFHSPEIALWDPPRLPPTGLPALTTPTYGRERISEPQDRFGAHVPSTTPRSVGLPQFSQMQRSIPFGLRSVAAGLDDMKPSVEHPVMAGVALKVYSSTTAVAKTDTDYIALHGRISQLRERFAYYQYKLDSLLSCFNSSGFDECLLDFWDEFFPLSAGVHFYDRYTLVPRKSCLRQFLSKPLPKAMGTMQCEIERIKTTVKKKGVKGRLFPSYEYRLFIRDRRFGPIESTIHPLGLPSRMDTVLMTAKNKGKHHQGMAAASSEKSSSSKRGVNNYYLYTPTKSDIDLHHAAVNSPSSAKLKSGNMQPVSVEDVPVELGRLQSNFIGTEFQIFSPIIKSQRRKKSPTTALSDGEVDAEILTNQNVVSCEQSSPPTRSRSFLRQRISTSRSTSRGRRSDSQDANDTEDLPQLAKSPEPTLKESMSRRGSWPSLYGGGSSRPSRRAIANATEASDDEYEPVWEEEENGAITYTANLLGNRPRIMDVCVPKVLKDGEVSSEWRRHCERNVDSDAGSMLSKFKQIQSRLDTDGNTQSNGNNDDPVENANTGNYGLLALQNRPPWWNVEIGAFVLNFGGRVSVASVKNFQLCDRSEQEHIMLQFGRIQGRHSFTMDFQYPLSAVQAFAIAISSLQSKISFG